MNNLKNQKKTWEVENQFFLKPENVPHRVVQNHSGKKDNT